MALHPVLVEKLNIALERNAVAATRRDATLPAIAGKAHAIIGMRRAGKSTFLLQLHADRLPLQGHERTIYLNFDDERLAGLAVDQLNLLLEEYYRRYPDFRGRDTVTWILDEIQLVEGWDRFVRRMLDTEQVEMIVSGSSAKMLSREVHTSLRGRGMETIIRPFGFREYLRHRDALPAAPDRIAGKARSGVEKLFLEFLNVGGFPEVQPLAREMRVELLQSYVDTVLFRDIIERHGITQITALRWLTRQFLKNPAGSFSVHRFHQNLRSQGESIGKDLLHTLVGHLEDAFLIRSVYLATESERQRNSNPRKVYPVDQGMIEAFDRSGRANLGHALETAVLHELDRRRAEISYVRTAEGHEVDFLAHFYDGTQELIQVCTDPGQPETLTRELRALAEAGKEYPKARQRILVATFDVLPKEAPENVVVEPTWRWMLEKGETDSTPRARPKTRRKTKV